MQLKLMGCKKIISILIQTYLQCYMQDTIVYVGVVQATNRETINYVSTTRMMNIMLV